MTKRPVSGVNTIQPSELIDLTSDLLYNAALQCQQDNVVPAAVTLPTTFPLARHSKQHSKLKQATHWNNTLLRLYHDSIKEVNGTTADRTHRPAHSNLQSHLNKLSDWTITTTTNAATLITTADKYEPLRDLLRLTVSEDADGVIECAYPGIKFDNVKSSKPSSYQPVPNKLSTATELHTQVFDMLSIGVIQSCFRLKYGCQRQGVNLCHTSRGILTLHPHLDVHTLDGLSDYSHIWLIFVFDDNGNKTFHATIHPPRLRGDKLGVYATRSPHRINPIGQTLVKLDKIVGRSLHISGIDLIDGTPVLDIKPAHPAEQLTDLTVPDWTLPDQLLTVRFNDDAAETLQQCVNKLQFYDKYDDALQAIKDVLALDARPYWHRSDSTALKPIMFDRVLVYYDINDHVCCVNRIELLSDEQIGKLKEQEAIAFNKQSAAIEQTSASLP